jgi:hypothetical protein
MEGELQAKAAQASELQEQVSELQAKLLDASQRDMDNQGAQDALQQLLSTLRWARLGAAAQAGAWRRAAAGRAARPVQCLALGAG